jgi:hypothetical protein
MKIPENMIESYLISNYQKPLKRMCKSKNGPFFLRSCKTDLPAKKLFSKKFHGIGPYPSPCFIFCAEITLKYSICDIPVDFSLVSHTKRQEIILVFNPDLHFTIFGGGF